MNNKVLIVIDMQNDFITGPLGSPEAKAIVPRVAQKMRAYAKTSGRILLTKDGHDGFYLDTPEGKGIPIPHCRIRSDGWLLHPEIANVTEVCENIIIHKEGFGFCGWGQLIGRNVDSIEIVGLCTDICVISNAIVLKTFYPKAEIIVDASCCAGTTPEGHNAAIRVMETCLIKVINQQTIGSEANA